jgi:hypothetical protein
MIDLPEQVRGMHRIRVDAGRDLRPVIADLIQPRIDGADVRGRDGSQPGLIEHLALDVAKVEGPIRK